VSEGPPFGEIVVDARLRQQCDGPFDEIGRLRRGVREPAEGRIEAP
jgi:hypothetical protein